MATKITNDGFGIGKGWSGMTFRADLYSLCEIVTPHGIANLTLDDDPEGDASIRFAWEGRLHTRRWEPRPASRKAAVRKAFAFVREIVGG
jgi:hypothetical protein